MLVTYGLYVIRLISTHCLVSLNRCYKMYNFVDSCGKVLDLRSVPEVVTICQSLNPHYPIESESVCQLASFAVNYKINKTYTK